MQNLVGKYLVIVLFVMMTTMINGIREVGIGVILDMDSNVGKSCRVSILMAIEEIYGAPYNNFTTIIHPHFHDSKSSNFEAASVATDLITNTRVMAILGPQQSSQANFVLDIAIGSNPIYPKSYGIWKNDCSKGVTTNEKKENTSKAIIFQTLPQDILMQVAQYSTAKEVWDSIKVKNLGADLVQKARLQTLRSELETLRIKPNEKVSDFGGKLSGIMAKFKGLGETCWKISPSKQLHNSVPKKFYRSFKEERIKSQDTLEANDQDKLLMASSNNKRYGKWRDKDFNKEGKESMKWKNNPNARRASTSQGTKDKSKLRCYDCGEYGHFAKECTRWRNNKYKQEESHLIYDTDTEPTLL
ncbi:zinc finger, CCHC-type containing protein [Tanacetum coccineum]